MALALQVGDIEDVAREIQLILKAKPPTDLREGWSLLKQGIHLLHARPKAGREGACQEVVHKVGNDDGFSLRDLPILKCWPKDGGRFITLPTCIRAIPKQARVTSASTGCKSTMSAPPECALHKVGARHGQRYYDRGERMPVAVTLGGDPVYTFAATAPLPDGLDDFFAGFLQKIN
jgi:4-hydroxy-3-polyprenylbenzoate decarboxylase